MDGHCKDCKYAVPIMMNQRATGKLQCRANPPTANVMIFSGKDKDGNFAISSNAVTNCPEVVDGFWCGAFTSKIITKNLL